MGAGADIVNGDIGGHGVRLVLSISNAELDPKVKEFLNNNPDIAKKTTYKITAYNFNPDSIKSTSEYGWGSTTYDKKEKGKTQEFVKGNNRQTLELKGNIYPEAFAWLDRALTSLIQQDDVIQDIKNLEAIGENGICLLLTEYDVSNMCTINHDYWFIRSIERTKEVFLYNNRPLKLDHSMVLEKRRSNF